tara:strand:- start:595 stop:783 length:189 start_codon:yes stop_codon:yes gene_type:complete
MSEYTVTYNRWYELGTFNSLEKAEEFAKRMETDEEIREYHHQHEVSGSIADLISISDTTGEY